MSGILPIRTEMLKRLKRLGYCEVEFLHNTCLAQKGTKARGHEFHYSAIIEDESASAGWQPSFRASFRRGKKVEQRGFCKGKILASYIHLHFGSGLGLDWLMGKAGKG
jgi:cobyrinic acid a,c-diamide synthase